MAILYGQFWPKTGSEALYLIRFLDKTGSSPLVKYITKNKWRRFYIQVFVCDHIFIKKPKYGTNFMISSENLPLCSRMMMIGRVQATRAKTTSTCRAINLRTVKLLREKHVSRLDWYCSYVLVSNILQIKTNVFQWDSKDVKFLRFTSQTNF